MRKRFDPVTGNIFSVFFYYAVPSVLGMLAMSCAVVIDGLFIGNYAGPIALAAVNLTVPLTGILFGIAMMFSVGGAARCGKYLGAGNRQAADAIFTQTTLITIVLATVFSIIGILFMEQVAVLLGANQVLEKTVAEYLTILLLFNIFTMGMVCLAYFLRVDNYPYLAAGAIVAGSVLNVFLDWLFVVHLQLGHRGAALGTGLSEFATFAILSLPFFFRMTRLRFSWQTKHVPEAFKAAWNGFSEFSNEISSGILILIFNWVIMQQLGENGVAAFAVINYIVLFGLMVSYGISDSLQPVVSKNYGARKPKRIRYFLAVSAATVLIIGITISLVLVISPAAVIGLFMDRGEKEIIGITVHFLYRIWPFFVLNGVNIILSSYLTAMHRAFPSTMIAVTRSLLLPVLFLGIIRLLTEYEGILIVLPLSELTTFFLALYLLSRNSPARLISYRHVLAQRKVAGSLST